MVTPTLAISFIVQQLLREKSRWTTSEIGWFMVGFSFVEGLIYSIIYVFTEPITENVLANAIGTMLFISFPIIFINGFVSMLLDQHHKSKAQTLEKDSP